MDPPEDDLEGNLYSDLSVEQGPPSPVVESHSTPNANCRQAEQSCVSGEEPIFSQNQRVQLQTGVDLATIVLADPVMTTQSPANEDDNAMLKIPVPSMKDQKREKEDLYKQRTTAATMKPAPLHGAIRTRVGTNSIDGMVMSLGAVKPANIKGGQNILTRLAYKLTGNGANVVIQNVTDMKVGNDLVKASLMGDSAVEFVGTTWKRQHPAPMNHQHIISWTTNGCVIDDMGPSLPNDYQTLGQGSVNSTLVANRLVTSSSVHNTISQYLSSSLMFSTDRWDTSSLYGVGFLLMSDLLARERLKQTPRPAAGVVGLEYINTRPNETGDIQRVVAKMLSDLPERRFIFKSHEISDSNCNVLAFIAAGGPSLQVSYNKVTLGSNISWPAIPMSIYGSNERLIPSPVVPHSKDVLRTLIKIAHLRNEGDMIVRGFIRAMCLWNGIRVWYTPTAEGAPKTVWMTSIGEIIGSIWPKPGDYNWIWRALSIAPTMPNAVALEGECSTLFGIDLDLLDRVGAAVASLMSVAVGTIWNSFNITGAQITQWAMTSNDGVKPRSIAIVKSLSKCNSSFVPGILHLATGVLEKFGDWSVNPLAFQSPGWSNLGNNFHPANPQVPSYWAQVFPHYVPYPISPLALGWALDHWIDVWGVCAPPISYNVREDFTQYGVWQANLGSKEYDVATLSNRPFAYVPYGLVATNIIHQRFEARSQIPVVFIPLIKVGDQVTEAEIHDHTNNMVYNVNLQIIMPGTMLTYNWDRQEVLAPSIGPDALEYPRWVKLIDEKNVTMAPPNVGINKPVT